MHPKKLYLITGFLVCLISLFREKRKKWSNSDKLKVELKLINFELNNISNN